MYSETAEERRDIPPCEWHISIIEAILIGDLLSNHWRFPIQSVLTEKNGGISFFFYFRNSLYDSYGSEKNNL